VDFHIVQQEVDFDFGESFASPPKWLDRSDCIEGFFRLQQFQRTIHLGANLWSLIRKPLVDSIGVGHVAQKCDHVNTFLLLSPKFRALTT
jgi:hypothetical protein